MHQQLAVTNIFDQIRSTSDGDKEYWSARKLAKVLGYVEYRNFQIVLKSAKESCKNSHQSIKNHFVDVHDMIEVGHNASRMVADVLLSRYACYLVMQNADPSKEVVALGQTYFALQTRKQEIQEETIEEQKRVFLRSEITAHNKHLAATAAQAGVRNYGVFTNYGYKGLYGGFSVQDIHELKQLKKSQKILDHMGSEELAANLFRATQTDAKLQRDAVFGEAKANQTHFEIGRKVRQTIKELGGTMPEKLPRVLGINAVKSKLKKLK